MARHNAKEDKQQDKSNRDQIHSLIEFRDRNGHRVDVGDVKHALHGDARRRPGAKNRNSQPIPRKSKRHGRDLAGENFRSKSTAEKEKRISGERALTRPVANEIS